MEPSEKTFHIIFYDSKKGNYLLPLTYTRPVSEIRIGLLTIREKWMTEMKGNYSYHTSAILSSKFPVKWNRTSLIINSCYLPDSDIISKIKTLKENEALYDHEDCIAALIKADNIENQVLEDVISSCVKIQLVPGQTKISKIQRPWEILSILQSEILLDFNRLTKNKKSTALSESNRIIGNSPVFAEEGVKAECCIFNTTQGPVYLGKGSEVMEGSMIRGPFLLGEGSTVNMGAKIYGPTAIGPKCKVGGEIKGTQFFGNANKGHDGFLGDSIIGEWCNLGADTNSSNLKNNYLPVRVWAYPEEKFIDSGLQFCGLIMGDHSKSGINTMFNTGTVVGAYSNIFGEGYPRTFIPSFVWGGAQGFQTHPVKKALETAEIVMKRRGIELSEEDTKLAEKIFQESKKFRTWEKE
ncbi:MAG: glucose-1-phosphate thymidylyltransferase [Saprospiraceae bacterium]|nr:glucose-1-phosphate thymidylyltransferase [Saprospiraceae bacterium]